MKIVNNLYFKLLSGKLKVYGDKLFGIFISDNGEEAVRVETFVDGGMYIYFDYQNSTDLFYNYDMKPTDLLNCKVGDIVKYYIDDCFQITTQCKHVMVKIKEDKSISVSESVHLSAFIDPCDIKFAYSADVGNPNKPIEYGYPKYLDKVNKFLYIYINKEVWKYSYQKDGHILRNFQFIEVVQS